MNLQNKKLMKKFSVFFALSLLFSVMWNTAGAAVYKADMNNPLITNVTTDAETQLSSNCTWMGINSANDNYSYNQVYIDDGYNLLAALVDDDDQTYWHSDPTTAGYTSKDEYLQVDLKRTDIDKFCFKLLRRNDLYNGTNRHGVMPQSFEIKGTNTPDDASSWTTVTTVTGIPAENNEDFSWPYVSPTITESTPYRYLRFICRKSNNPYWCMSEFQVYPVKEVTDPTELLQILVDSITTANVKYLSGTNPGYYAEDKVVAFETAYENANTLLQQSPTSEQCIASTEALRKAMAEADASLVKIHDGYYYIVSAYPAYEAQQKVKKSMSVSLDEMRLTWGNLDTTDPFQLFKITVLNGDTCMIQNATGKYIGAVDGDATVSTVYVPITDEQSVDQYFTLLKEGSAQFNIANKQNSIAYHCLGHGDGAGENGYIVPAKTGYDSPAAWYLQEADAATVDALLAAAQKKADASLVQKSIDDANEVRELANDYEALITEAEDEDDAHNQFYSNARWTYLDKDKSGGQGSYAGLIDGSKETYFHSDAKNAIGAYHFLQVNLKRTDVSAFTFKMLRRGDGNWKPNWNQLPIDIAIYGTNDADALTDITPFDDTDSPWKFVQEITKGFPDASSHDYYYSPMITMKQAYQYIRFVVKNTHNRGNDPSGFPYFNLSEFQIYNTVPTTTSEYYTVAGMKDACDKLDALVAAAKEKVANLTATPDDTTAINEAKAAVKALYVDRTAIQAVLKDKVDEAKTAYQTAFSYDALITNAPDDGSGQINSSCLWTTPSADNGNVSYSSLIDNNLNTFFHSNPNDGRALNMSWAYLQFDLGRDDIQKFNFNMYGRVGKNHATPNLIDVYVTKDPTDEKSWKKAASLIKGFQGDISGAYYLSPDIDLGDTYRYIRLYILGSASGTTYFNIAEMQLYNAEPNQAKSQYYYTEGVKPAADALKALIDATQAKLDNNTATSVEDTVALNKAIADLGVLVYNPASFTYLVNDAQAYVDNADAGTDIGQLAQGDIDALKTAITTAKAAVNYEVVKKEEFEPAKIALQNAVNTFLSKVNTIEPNKWYYILNAADAATYPTANGKAMCISSTSTGQSIIYGNGFGVASDVQDVMYINDPYSMWRFVPIEGTEYYALQNYGSGHYAGEYGGDNSAPMQRNKPYPYTLYYLGKSGMSIKSADSLNIGAYGLYGSDNSVIMQKMTMSISVGTPSAWKFVPVETTEMHIATTMNYMRSACYPFTIPAETFGADGFNPGMMAYGVCSLTTDEEGKTSKVGLYELTGEIPAGTPFILIAGDNTVYDPENATSEPFAFDKSADGILVDSALTVNGLVGTLDGLTLNKAGLGYVSNNALSVTTNASASLIGGRAYIDPNKVATLDKKVALYLTIDGILNGTEKIDVDEILANGKVNVYGTAGQLIKSDVKAADAAKGLEKGIYLIGKKKIAIK